MFLDNDTRDKAETSSRLTCAEYITLLVDADESAVQKSPPVSKFFVVFNRRASWSYLFTEMVGEVCNMEMDYTIPVLVNFQRSNGKTEERERDVHPEDPLAVIPRDEDFPALIRVVVVGHSFIRRLKEHLAADKGPSFNFGLDPAIVDVTLLARGGLTVHDLQYSMIQRVKGLRPHLVYIEVGSNDATSPHLQPDEIASDMCLVARNLVQAGIQRVIFGQVLWRGDNGNPAACQHYNWKVVILNRRMAQMLPRMPSTTFWKHRGLWNSAYPILTHDGVHLSEVGNHRLFRSIRGAIIQAIPFIQP